MDNQSDVDAVRGTSGSRPAQEAWLYCTWCEGLVVSDTYCSRCGELLGPDDSA